MTPRQNALANLRFGQPERLTGGIPTYGLGYFGINHENAEGGGHHLPVGSRWTDMWGVGWHKEQEGMIGFPREHPLADLPHALPKYKWPNPDDERLYRPIYEGARKPWDRDAVFLSGQHRDTLWERAYQLVGMENLMCWFHEEPAAVRDLLHRIMDFQIGISRHYLACGVETVGLGDDLGTQNSLLLSPQTIQEFLVPEYQRLFGLYTSRGIVITFHSCGHIEPLLEIFIALGVDCLNPVQATANNLAEVRRVTQGRMALQGGVSTGLIIEGPPERIRAEVRRCIDLLGAQAGYFPGADQGMPWTEHHGRALTEAVAEFGAFQSCLVA
jgi:uroporphyrinogen decarboxylase